jgi:hypothetical protein
VCGTPACCNSSVAGVPVEAVRLANGGTARSDGCARVRDLTLDPGEHGGHATQPQRRNGAG